MRNLHTKYNKLKISSARVTMRHHLHDESVAYTLMMVYASHSHIRKNIIQISQRDLPVKHFYQHCMQYATHTCSDTNLMWQN